MEVLLKLVVITNSDKSSDGSCISSSSFGKVHGNEMEKQQITKHNLKFNKKLEYYTDLLSGDTQKKEKNISTLTDTCPWYTGTLHTDRRPFICSN